MSLMTSSENFYAIQYTIFHLFEFSSGFIFSLLFSFFFFLLFDSLDFVPAILYHKNVKCVLVGCMDFYSKLKASMPISSQLGYMYKEKRKID